MDLETVVKRRRMCREFLDRELPREKVDRILDLACRYPSAGHTEPQEFIVVRDQRVKENLARAALGQMFVAQAPLVIVVVSGHQPLGSAVRGAGSTLLQHHRRGLRRDDHPARGGGRGFRGLFCCGVSRSESAAGVGLAARCSANRNHPHRLLLRDTEEVGAPIQGADQPSRPVRE